MIGDPDHRIGNQMRRMRHHGQHQIMVFGVHLIDIGPHAAPQIGQPVHRRPVGSAGHQNAPAVVEQRGETGSWAGIFSSGKGMGRNEMHALRQMRGNSRNNRALDRADIAECCPRFQICADLGSDGTHRANRHT